MSADTELQDQGFTPGPWISTGYDYEEEAGWFIREDTGGVQRKAVARVSGSFRTTEEIEANARLIAAAPDLYAALAEFVELLDAGKGSLSHQLEYAMRDALAKARQPS